MLSTCIHPSIKLVKIKKAVDFFSKKLTISAKQTIWQYLELICFGTSSALITFNGEYYEYHGGERKEQGLSIGDYKSVFLADLVTS